MAAETFVSRKSDAAAIIPWRGLMAAVLALSVGWGGIVYAANNSVQGAPKKEDGGFDGDVHYYFESTNDRFILGEQVPHEGIPLPGFFWSDSGLPTALQTNTWQSLPQETIDCVRYSLQVSPAAF